MSKKTKAAKHNARLRSHRKKRRRPNPLVLPAGFVPPQPEALMAIMFDQVLLQFLRTTGIRDALFKIIKNAPTKQQDDEDDEPQGPAPTVQ